MRDEWAWYVIYCAAYQLKPCRVASLFAYKRWERGLA